MVIESDLLLKNNIKNERNLNSGKKNQLESLIQVLIAKTLGIACKELYQTTMMEKSFASVGLNLNIDGSQPDQMKFQGQKKGKTKSFQLLI